MRNISARQGVNICSSERYAKLGTLYVLVDVDVYVLARVYMDVYVLVDVYALVRVCMDVYVRLLVFVYVYK